MSEDIMNLDLGLDMEESYDSGFDPLPNGLYLMSIDSIEIKNTKDGQGKYLNVKFKVVSDEYNGRAIFCKYNIVNANDKAVSIAKAELQKLAVACRVEEKRPQIKDYTGKIFCAKLKIGKEYNGSRQNEIDNYLTSDKFSAAGVSEGGSVSEKTDGGPTW